MNNPKSKWLAYTVLVGLSPILSRLLVWAISSENVVPAFSAADFVAFGLVLHISNINELEHTSSQNKSWKTLQNGISLIFIVLYSVIFAVLLIAEKIPKLIDPKSLLYCVIALTTTSMLLSLSVVHRLNASTRSAR